MHETTKLSRAEAVNLLWRFKQACEKDQTDVLPFVHFNSLLNDQEYREEILNKSSDAGDAHVRALARHLLKRPPEGSLIGPKAHHNGSVNGSAAAVSRGIHLTEPVAAAPPGGASLPTPKVFVQIALSMMALLGLSVLAWWAWSLMPRDVQVTDAILQDTIWTKGSSYTLDKIIYVDAGAKLVIEPGVTVLGKPGSALVITRGAALHARGRADAPIVFTSALPEGERKPGDWGGLVMLGHAPVNVPDAHIEGIDENNPRGKFGGRDEASSCGVLEFARIEFAGFEVYANNELNGLTLGGCGSGTIIRHVQVHRSLDDGIEAFGGTVDLRNILVSGPGDDGFDWDMGWQGRVQFLVVQMYPQTGDNAFEGDNLKADPARLPRSAPQFFNVTLVADPDAEKAQRAMTIRRGSAGEFGNFLIQGFSAEAFDMIGIETAMLAMNGVLQMQGIALEQIGYGGKLFFTSERGDADDDEGFSELLFFSSRGRGNQLDAKTGLGLAARSLASPDYRPDADRQLLPEAQSIPQGEFWDESAEYLGAFRPESGVNWLAGWSAFPLN